jgi:hypothetical protein
MHLLLSIILILGAAMAADNLSRDRECLFGLKGPYFGASDPVPGTREKMARDAIVRVLAVHKKIAAGARKAGVSPERFVETRAREFQGVLRALLACDGAMAGYRETIYEVDPDTEEKIEKSVGFSFYLDAQTSWLRKRVSSDPKVISDRTRKGSVGSDDLLDAYPEPALPKKKAGRGE